LHTRDQLRLGRDGEAKVTAIAVFDGAAAVQQASAAAGDIAKVWGLRDARIGDAIGELDGAAAEQQVPPPAPDAVVPALAADDGHGLRLALVQLAEQDPLIDVRQNGASQELSVSLYGEVQKEVLQATLADDYGLEVAFLETTPIYVERPVGVAEAVEVLHAESNPFNATIGLRVEPAPAGTGVEFRFDVDSRTAPLYVYKRVE